MNGHTHNDAGFTLVEVLISMFIFALLTAGTMTALTQSLRGKASLDTSMEALNRVKCRAGNIALRYVDLNFAPQP